MTGTKKRKEARYGQEINENQDGSRGTDVRLQGAHCFERDTSWRFHALAKEPHQPEKTPRWHLASKGLAGPGRASLPFSCGWRVARRPGVQAPSAKPVWQSGFRRSGLTSVTSPLFAP